MDKRISVKYIGDVSPVHVKIYGGFFKFWHRGEVRELSEREATKLLKDNVKFALVGDESIVNREQEPKEEEVEEEEGELNLTKEEIKGMSKDFLLDATARLEINANYSQNKSELRQLLFDYYGYEE